MLSAAHQIWVARDTLKSDWALALAKDTAKDMMLSRREEHVSSAESGGISGTKPGTRSGTESGNQPGTEGDGQNSDAAFDGADNAASTVASTDADDSESSVESDMTVDVHGGGNDEFVDEPATDRGYGE